jgi:hypothetical protein
MTLMMTIGRLRFLITLFAALTLPLQAAAGLAMPLGGQGGEASMSVADETMAAMPEDCPMHQQQTPAQPHDCGHCGVCHLAATGFIFPGEVAAVVVPAVETYAAVIEAAPSSHISEPPRHPPRRSA